jgi:hypothetical protein
MLRFWSKNTTNPAIRRRAAATLIFFTTVAYSSYPRAVLIPIINISQ